MQMVSAGLEAESRAPDIHCNDQLVTALKPAGGL